MEVAQILARISRGRTDLILDLFDQPNWKELLQEGQVKPLQWLVYYNDTTGLKAVLKAGGTLDSINLHKELGHAAFFGHWKVCDFLINNGADVNAHVDTTNETPLHSALSKAGRPYYFYTVKLLVDKGANVNAKTIPGIETGAFMRDVRTKGETPLHRAAAYADEKTISYLIEHGADKTAKDANGDSPLSWASEHLRPGNILSLLSYGKYHIGDNHKAVNTSDHGQGWGNSMDWKLFGEYLPEKD
ncbi:ankyrin repeat domain-containing protein [Flavitalea sp. BT771]|uniref:ankyrin repeat domain-containing protein n=1 Tax=Flavitalea sp. BT771 TaxID=3063329 RepID=UPI0026E33B56|nr:ankyrin repeat domain-containing protein [Flavitalea sp. BT771]MDO6432695.1 ankyrin repeat domain-containing protein [Flavitalea sp. BT771]MDV6222029.1 ankyrin repeat domain-containing protein [Flavitalea sp. BT771]